MHLIMIQHPKIFSVLFLTRHVSIFHLRVSRYETTKALLYTDFLDIKIFSLHNGTETSVVIVHGKHTTIGDWFNKNPGNSRKRIMSFTRFQVQLFFYEFFLHIITKLILKLHLLSYIIKLT